MTNKKTQRISASTITLVIIATILLVFIIIGVLKIFYPMDKPCLAERLCWDNGYGYYNSLLVSRDEVKCYETNEKGDNILHEFIKINWTALDEKYVCDG